MSGDIRTGIGGWTFEPWDKSFYPKGLAKKRQLEYASRQLSTIEVNGTYYRTQTPETFAKWAAEVPDGFVFALKASRFSTNRKVLAEAGESVERFIGSGLAELGDRLGPIVWQFAPTKQFDPDDFGAFLALLPAKTDGLALHHAVEVRNPSFVSQDFVSLARRHGVAIVYAEHETYPEIADVTADFVYLRLQKGRDEIETAYPSDELDQWAGRLKTLAAGETPGDLPLAAPDAPAEKRSRDVFAYFIHEGKVRAPHAAMALAQRLT
ncbi:DUF72 domain-containing protein [Aureimonas mangrovi]|uniref:DUF72 domain-containing protein n=1 Tax=Aureimonas mangrovi TaxID=2758041 RepID=UPI00163D8C14|nr:DUF72 domain-containing protein [Aureimonas mangrovi]